MCVHACALSWICESAVTVSTQGLMPNPKLGTIVDESGIKAAVELAKKGRITYRYVRSHARTCEDDDIDSFGSG